MLEVIRIWLNGKREYFPGVAIAMQFHKNAAILEVMKKADNPRNRDRLKNIMEEEFDRLNKDQESIYSLPAGNGKALGKLFLKMHPLQTVSLPSPPADQQAAESPHLKSTVYKAAKEEADKAYKQLMALRAVLFDKVRQVEEWEDPNTPGRVQERCKLAIEVVTGYREVSKLYEKADFILQNGTVPVTEETNEVPYQALPDKLAFKELTNLRKAYSKLKNKPPTADRLARMEGHLENIKKLEAQCRTLN